MKLIKFEETGSIDKLWFSLGNLKIEFIFETKNWSNFSAFYTFAVQ